MAAPLPVSKSQGCSLASILVVVAVVVVIGAFVFWQSGHGTQSQSALPTSADAYAMSQQFVNQQLKAPKTAQYPAMSDPQVSITNQGGTYQVTAYVDSENSFGALIRSHYTAVVQWMGGSQWKLVSLKFLDAQP